MLIPQNYRFFRFKIKTVAWISVGLVYSICLVNSIGWLFNIASFKSIDPRWIPMKVITSLCFTLAATALLIIIKYPNRHRKLFFSKLIGITVSLVGSLTILIYYLLYKTGFEPAICDLPLLRLFLSPETRMALLTAIIFLFTGVIIFMTATGKKPVYGIAHTLTILVGLVCYMIPVSYILGVYSMHQFLNIPVALNTGISFCFICVAIFSSRPDTWLMKLIVSDRVGSVMARRLLPGLFIIPVIIAWLRIQGERQGLFVSEVGVVFVAMTYTFCLLFLVWLSARSVNRTDEKRKISEEALRQNEENFRVILDATQESIFLFNRQGRFIAANHIGSKRLNLTPSDMLDHHFSEYMSPELASLRMEHLKHVIDSGLPEHFEDIREGQRFEHHFYPCFKDEEVCYVATYSRDVTDIRNKELELIKFNRILKALSKSSQAMLRASDESSYLNEVCRIVVEDCNFAMVWIGFSQQDKEMSVKPVAYSGFEKGYLETLNISWADNEQGQGPTGTAIRTGQPAVCKDMITDPAFKPWRKEALKRGYASSLVLPLLDKGVAFGAINIYSTEPDPFTGEEINFLTELASDLAYGILSIRMKSAQGQAEKELYNTKNYLENLINYANAPIIVWNPNNQIQLFNNAFEELTGYSAANVIGTNLYSLFPEETLENSKKMIEQSLLERWETVEIPILCKNKEVKTILWNSANIYEPDNKTLISTIAQGHDITERNRALLQLRQSEEKLNLALENGSIGIWVWNIVTNDIEWDERMERMFGIEQGSFGKSYDAFEAFLIDEDIPHVRNAIRKALEKDVHFETVYRIKLDDGTVKHISAKALVTKNNDGEPVKMTGVCFDITELKKDAEQVLFNLNDELLRSNKELEQFAYVASHDLQEPLRMVSSFTQLLAQRYNDRLDQDAKEFIQYAVDGASRMQILINDLLSYSRIQSKGKKFSSVDMGQVLGKVNYNLSSKIQEKNALINSDELPEVYADEGQMVQLFQNLIGNALKFSQNTPIVHISSREEKNQFVFSVKDNGIGIDKQYFERIFQIFQRLQSKEDYEGTGIGLAICKRIIERHGGKIWVESETGKGTTFFFTISKFERS